MGLIYMRTSPSGGKYIGKTIMPEAVRWRDHCKEANNPNNDDYNTILNRAIRKYGGENFTVEILEDNIPANLLSAREQYYIQKYNTYYKNNPLGYNMTVGGDGSYQYSDEFILQLWDSGKNIKELKDEYNLNYNNLSRRLKNLGISKEEINERAYYNNNPKRKKVDQFSLDGKYIQTFNSITEAANAVNSNTTNISGVCTGRRKSCKGFIWKYKV